MMMTGIKITSSNAKILKIFFISKNKIKRNKNINMNYSFINWQNKNLGFRMIYFDDRLGQICRIQQ